MIRMIDVTNPKIAEEVLEIQIQSYKVEAMIINFYDIPPLKDTVQTLQQCGETFFGYYYNEKLCGVLSMKQDKNVLDIHRLAVHPHYFKRGIAQQLLDFIEIHTEGIDTVIVSTGSKNRPAVHFYLKNGFSRIGEMAVNDNLFLTTFKKIL